MSHHLTDNVALVTGGGRGIGRAIALNLAQDGADIALFDLDENGLNETKPLIEKIGRKVLTVKGNVSKLEDAENAVKKVLDELGKIDILVNNAGITRDTLVMRMSEEDWDLVINVNLKGTFNFSKSVIRHMLKQRKGKIINVASVVGLVGNAGQANYSASKAGVIGLTKSLAREVASRNICVNAVAPGYIETEMTNKLPEEVKDAFMSMTLLKRFGQPEDVARLVNFLASPDSDYITGQVINVDGGLVT
ncbi:3-oxoacyl-[acyl-carrier-protein] reductase [candidate division KSB1 bacterium]